MSVKPARCGATQGKWAFSTLLLVECPSLGVAEGPRCDLCAGAFSKMSLHANKDETPTARPLDRKSVV